MPPRQGLATARPVEPLIPGQAAHPAVTADHVALIRGNVGIDRMQHLLRGQLGTPEPGQNLVGILQPKGLGRGGQRLLGGALAQRMDLGQRFLELRRQGADLVVAVEQICGQPGVVGFQPPLGLDLGARGLDEFGQELDLSLINH